jgi:tetratricopeptide (TPR) repeat protein
MAFRRGGIKFPLILGLVLATAAAVAVGLYLTSAISFGGNSEAEKASEALNRGLQAHVEGSMDEATAAYREVLEHDPHNKFAFYNLGLIDQTLDRPESAENNYRLALSEDPDYAPALFNLAILRKAAGADQEAVELYRRVVNVQPDNAGAHLNLGLLLRSIGQTADGDAEIQRAVELDPTLVPPASPEPSAAGDAE